MGVDVSIGGVCLKDAAAAAPTSHVSCQVENPDDEAIVTHMMVAVRYSSRIHGRTERTTSYFLYVST